MCTERGENRLSSPTSGAGLTCSYRTSPNTCTREVAHTVSPRAAGPGAKGQVPIPTITNPYHRG